MKELRKCKECGKDFLEYTYSTRVNCSKECQGIAAARRRTKKRETRTCVICGKAFEIIPSRKDQCCSRECSDKKRSLTCAARPPKPPREPKVRHCITCGADIINRGGAKWCKSCQKSGRREAARTYYKTQQYKEAHRRIALDQMDNLAREWQKRNPAKMVASRLARHYPELLQILYECPCEINGNGKHHHHFDYARPYEVIKLCDSCHMKEEKRLRDLAAQAASNTHAESVEEHPANATAPSAMTHRPEIAGSVHADTGTC